MATIVAVTRTDFEFYVDPAVVVIADRPRSTVSKDIFWFNDTGNKIRVELLPGGPIEVDDGNLSAAFNAATIPAKGALDYRIKVLTRGLDAKGKSDPRIIIVR